MGRKIGEDLEERIPTFQGLEEPFFDRNLRQLCSHLISKKAMNSLKKTS